MCDGRVLLITSDGEISARVGRVLGSQTITVASYLSEAAALAGRHAYSAILVDLAVAGAARMQVIRDWSASFAPTPVIAIAEEGTSIEDVMRAGGDVISKPLDADELLFAVRKATAGADRRADLPPPSSMPMGGIVGTSPAMLRVKDLICRASSGTATVLVRGETGTGKELVARAIHARSARAAGPFVKIDCTSLPDALLESELFGYEKGAFTGAAAQKPGRVELAQGGTLFFDEIGDVSPAMQPKLLRLLSDREFERLGGRQTLKIDARFITATHRNLEAMVRYGEFRQDLFFRLSVVPLHVPALRARREDIPALAEHFCRALGGANGKPGAHLELSALESLCAYDWPGNVRQLQNFVERMLVLTDGPAITRAEVERELGQQISLAAPPPSSVGQRGPESSEVQPLDEAVRQAERRMIVKALKRSNGNQTIAARVLGVSRATLYSKLKEYAIE